MILALDIGNSNITIGAFEKGALIFTARLITDCEMTASGYAERIQGILLSKQRDITSIDGAVICSVVPCTTGNIASAIELLTGRAPVVIDNKTDFGLKIQMDDPMRVGTDLLVGASNACIKYEAPLCVIDLGTFTTLCYVSGQKEYQGTIIIPGIRTTEESYSKAAQLFTFEINSPESLFGTNTKDSMTSGLMNGAAAMIDGLIDRIEDEKGELKSIIVTGGFAEKIIPLLKHEVTEDENLLLDGLHRLYYSF